ncbi:uncharacterized protein F5891DRAFT_1211182 [Suillus fuscotomentosus]|uniref:G domain-containing protein n=1 Tax=Suillus fuscotomentosus TaxID=1912939 RepID=A0AAD4DRF6_9AGAM|nr:uncharacterized protein F5891DRAFT_1211182 [Suillus fuscotomentosus]KAG1891685.1 hypothetical protein F5891DRAFT_1211182 [Suillus fuscotomentosus]
MAMRAALREYPMSDSPSESYVLLQISSVRVDSESSRKIDKEAALTEAGCLPLINSVQCRSKRRYLGETGAGKSSVINLLAGQAIAHISPDSHRCTLHWPEYQITFEDGVSIQGVDTVASKNLVYKPPVEDARVLEVEAGAVHPVHAEIMITSWAQEERSLLEHSHLNMDPNFWHPDQRASSKNIHEEVVAALRGVYTPTKSLGMRRQDCGSGEKRDVC